MKEERKRELYTIGKYELMDKSVDMVKIIEAQLKADLDEHTFKELENYAYFSLLEMACDVTELKHTSGLPESLWQLKMYSSLMEVLVNILQGWIITLDDEIFAKKHNLEGDNH